MKPWNLTPRADGAGIDITLFGIIADDWFGPPVEAEIAAQLAANRTAHATVHINSQGGDMFAGIAIRNLLAAHPGGVTCIVEGLAASAASIVAMAGKTVMGKGAMMMVHNPWAVAMGDAEDLRAAADMLDKAQASLVSIYEAKTGKSAEELKALLDAETWMTADEALAAGFADEVTAAPVAVTASAEAVLFNAVAFPRASLPQRILAMAPTPAAAPPPRALTRDILAAEAPDLLAALLAEGLAAAQAESAPAIATARAEGEKAGTAAERARLKAIDELLGDSDETVIAAKYGEQPGTAETLAVALLKAHRASPAAALAARRSESAAVAGIKPSNADAGRHSDERAVATQIAAFANARRGGVR